MFDLGNTASIDEDELPGENGNHDNDTEEECVVGGQNEGQQDPNEVEQPIGGVVAIREDEHAYLSCK